VSRSLVKESGVSDEAGGREHSVLCLRLMQLFPRVSRGMRRWQDRVAPSSGTPLGPRHVAALQQLRGGPVTVGELAGFIDRSPDPADRRRTLVQIQPAQAAVVEQWLDGAASPLARVLDKLAPSERAAFLKAMNMLEEELTADDARP
jgi:hypothetical protein